MDFSKVRLVDFSQAKLRDNLNVEHDVKPVNHVNEPATVICAQAPEYTVSALPIIPEIACKDILSLDTSLETRHCLAVTEHELVVWKILSDSKLAFGLPENHQVSALFVAGSFQQPEMVIIDKLHGKVTHFDFINRAILSADTKLASGCVGKVPLGREEVVEHIEIIPDIGLVVSTNRGHFYLINLRNELGKQQVIVSLMRHGSGLLSRLRSLGTFTRDVTTIKCGRLMDRVREVLVANVYGDIAVWRVGMNGFHELVNEVHVGPKLNAHMDLLYPNSGITMVVHDLVVDNERTHIVASFAPSAASAKRNLIVMSLNSDYDVVSVRRLQTYEADGPVKFANLSLINDVLVVVCENAILMVDTPSRAEDTITARWEECLFLKSNVMVLGSKTENNEVIVKTSNQLLKVLLSAERSRNSTTRTRLEQAVFESSPMNPLDLSKWSSYESEPEVGAAVDLARDISDSRTPFVPAKLPDLSAHLELRVSKLLALYELVPAQEIREITQALVAASVVYNAYLSDSKEIDNCLARIKPGTDLKSILMHETSMIPVLLENLIRPGNEAALFLEVLQACDSNQLGIPIWATNGCFKESLEHLTSRAEDSQDLQLLEVSVKMLCAVYASQGMADCPTAHGSLMKLANLGSSKAIEIAYQYKIWSILAPLEVGLWVQSGDANSVIAHITELGSPYSDYVFEACVSSGHSLELVQVLSPIFTDAVRSFLISNKLYKIAWTLDPSGSECTEQLALATSSATSLAETRLYASLYKISAYVTGTDDGQNAQTYLDLAAAQEILSRQYLSSNSASAIVKHGLKKLRNGAILDSDSAVDLLALSPPQAVPETNENFVLGFKLLKPSDTVRQHLLVQQLVINTNWDRARNAGNHNIRRLKESLFYQTAHKISPNHGAMLEHFRTSLVIPQHDDIRKAYSWDLNNVVPQELVEIAQKAINIADKYNIDELVSKIFEKSAEYA